MRSDLGQGRAGQGRAGKGGGGEGGGGSTWIPGFDPVSVNSFVG